MKQIQPFTLWVNGQQATATLFSLIIINDNLSSSATFYWQLLDADASKLADGNLTMVEPQYDQWGTQSDVNQWAYEWAATELNITLA
tara:strand:- start:4158 stop:4418 length:261 start_codon:yes stop_codon:yes gene_type:complete